jgi:hypothetical protein
MLLHRLRRGEGGDSVGRRTRKDLGEKTVGVYTSEVETCTPKEIEDGHFKAVTVVARLQAGVSIDCFCTFISAAFYLNIASLIQGAGRCMRMFGLTTRVLDPAANFGRMPLIADYEPGSVIDGVLRFPDAQICHNPECLAIHTVKPVIPRKKPAHITGTPIGCPKCGQTLWGDCASIRSALARCDDLEKVTAIHLGVSLGVRQGPFTEPISYALLKDLGLWKNNKEKPLSEIEAEPAINDLSEEFLERVAAAIKAFESQNAKADRQMSLSIPQRAAALSADPSHAAQMQNARDAQSALCALISSLFINGDSLATAYDVAQQTAHWFTMRGTMLFHASPDDEPLSTPLDCVEIVADCLDRVLYRLAKSANAQVAAWLEINRQIEVRSIDSAVAKGQSSKALEHLKARIALYDRITGHPK